MNGSPAVDTWMAEYEGPQKALMAKVRECLLKADDRLTEAVKWSAPTFVYKGNLATFNPRSKGHVSLMFHTGARIPGVFPALEGNGQEARVMRILGADDLAAKADELTRIVRAWCDLADASR